MKNDLLELLGEIKDFIEEESGQGKIVVKSLPMKKEWLKERNRIAAEIEKMGVIKDAIVSDSKRFWAQVQLDLNDFTTSKRINLKTNEIEIMGDKNPKPLIKSPLSEI